MASWAGGQEAARINRSPNRRKRGAEVVFKRGNSLWYKFRWSVKHEDGTKENFLIRRPAKVRNRNDAKDVEREHRRALSLGQVHPNDPWPKPAVSVRSRGDFENALRLPRGQVGGNRHDIRSRQLGHRCLHQLRPWSIPRARLNVDDLPGHLARRTTGY